MKWDALTPFMRHAPSMFVGSVLTSKLQLSTVIFSATLLPEVKSAKGLASAQFAPVTRNTVPSLIAGSPADAHRMRSPLHTGSMMLFALPLGGIGVVLMVL